MRSPGPRKAQSVFDATLGLLTELGYDGLTIEGVAARSGVHKTTIYRWWPSKDALLGAALLDANLLELSVPDTGGIDDDLRSLVEQVLRLLTGKATGATVTAILGAATHRPALASLVTEFFAGRLARERIVFERAIARGELREGTDPGMIMDLLAGAIWLRVLARGETPRAGYVRSIVSLVLDGARP
ncbi:TetR family transcriptional regulator [Prauserella marina]|uniref:DNA-binding transcriptional regulator, AcrR family n=1 Tax=Prauserella marina TaxID=530584 RepID=A0A222VLY2_9PSEU|nr:TetR/AcrR family transcriptional regulator [Prauserella marina]ASR34928.1 TetR family transcriptional regulator [Prauserella marina]PWV85362.1 TetR family transcriptional regulator [Prauserella marina]SDC56610.1 DNA-binding transcriptional regulator, AcrR family [Prauserella marina]